jgi:hypothetical protein
MSKYKEIKGFKVQTLTSDTAASIAATGTWASAPSLNTGRGHAGSSKNGTTSASIYFGGYPPTNPRRAETENFNGSSWTEVGDLNSGRSNMASFGTATAAISSGGSTQPGVNVASNESWNGSAWTEVGDLNSGRRELAGLGITTAGLAVGGTSGSALVESWNGSSFTEVGDLNTGRANLGGAGTSTAALAFGGNGPEGETETWNGSAWTETSDLNTARTGTGNAGPVYTDVLMFGGTGSTVIANTENWDGSSWSELNDLATARTALKGSGTSASALAIGGQETLTNTEEWTTSSSITKTNLGQVYFNSTSNTFKVTQQLAPSGTWASGGNLNSPRGNAGSSGTQTAALFFGGDGPPGTIAITEQYNGSSWTEVGDLNSVRSQMFFSNQGTQTAALSATGEPVSTNVESWDGSSWTETTENNTGRRNGASFGTQTAMLGTGGYIPPGYQTLTEQWDGSSWTEVADCPDPKFISRGGGGTTTAGIVAGNYPNGDADGSQLWDGSSWTAGPNLNQGRSGIAFSATSQSNALAHGGGVGTPQAASALTEFYNGTSWTELNDMAQVSQSGGGAGSAIEGIHMGGYGPGALVTTEEWTTSISNSTITVS